MKTIVSDIKIFIDILMKNKQKYPFANLLFYTYANKNYFPFAILYPLFVLNFNKNAVVEIALSNEFSFRKKYKHLIDFYNENFPNKVFFHQLDGLRTWGVKEGTFRFITKPRCSAKYIYIGDIDIIILEDILDLHLNNIKNNNLDFSNIKRKNCKKLSGLHFIEYKKMYPIKFTNIFKCDEKVLYDLMSAKGYKIPDESLEYRPIHGLHISFFSRPPFKTLTTNDRLTDYPCWIDNSQDCSNFLKIYKNIRYTAPIIQFMEKIKEKDVELRRLIQIMDSTTSSFEISSNNPTL